MCQCTASACPVQTLIRWQSNTSPRMASLKSILLSAKARPCVITYSLALHAISSSAPQLAYLWRIPSARSPCQGLIIYSWFNRNILKSEALDTSGCMHLINSIFNPKNIRFDHNYPASLTRQILLRIYLRNMTSVLEGETETMSLHTFILVSIRIRKEISGRCQWKPDLTVLSDLHDLCFR